ncbi:MAG TPA: hypothetical protein VHL08_00025 [Dongiaceae bacterium]|nr:hypothetical protein [Dongiaceae bacterium]
MTSDELDIIEARAAAATPGPWQVLTEDGVDAAWINAARAEDDLPIALLDYRSGDDNRANAEFIAAARVDIMRMIEALREAQQRIQHLILANNREVEQRVEIKRQLEQAQARHLGGEK